MAVSLADGVSIPVSTGTIKSFGIAGHANGPIPDSSTSLLERNCNFDIDREPDFLRKTHIICTLGMRDEFYFILFLVLHSLA